MLLVGAVVVGPVATYAGDEVHENLGQSAAHPLSRFDLRTKYANLTAGRAAMVLTARLDRPFRLRSGWKLNTRVNMTGIVSDLPSSDNPAGDVIAGTGDLFTQLLLIMPKVGNTSFGFGGRFSFPTAAQDQLGSGKYRIAPIALALHFPGWMSAGSFFGLGLRNELSYTGDGDREDVNELQLVPIVNIALPDSAFLSFFPHIRVDWEHDNRVFVPMDIEYGRKFTANRAASLRFQVPIIDDLDPYDWAIEARFSFFF